MAPCVEAGTDCSIDDTVVNNEIWSNSHVTQLLSEYCLKVKPQESFESGRVLTACLMRKRRAKRVQRQCCGVRVCHHVQRSTMFVVWSDGRALLSSPSGKGRLAVK